MDEKTKSKFESKIPIVVAPVAPTDPLSFALDVLQSTRQPATSCAGPDGYQVIRPGAFEPAAVAAMRGMLGNKEFDFRLSKCSTISSGASVLAVNVATDLTQFNEGTALASLFDEVRLIKTSLRLAYSTFPAYQSFPFMIGYEAMVSTITPTSTIVSRLPNSKLCVYYAAPNEVMSDKWALTAPAPAGRPFGLVADEGVSVPRIASGLNGTFKVVNVSGCPPPTSSAVHFAYVLVTYARFRCRA